MLRPGCCCKGTWGIFYLGEKGSFINAPESRKRLIAGSLIGFSGLFDGGIRLILRAVRGNGNNWWFFGYSFNSHYIGMGGVLSGYDTTLGQYFQHDFSNGPKDLEIHVLRNQKHAVPFSDRKMDVRLVFWLMGTVPVDNDFHHPVYRLPNHRALLQYNFKEPASSYEFRRTWEYEIALPRTEDATHILYEDASYGVGVRYNKLPIDIPPVFPGGATTEDVFSHSIKLPDRPWQGGTYHSPNNPFQSQGGVVSGLSVPAGVWIFSEPAIPWHPQFNYPVSYYGGVMFLGDGMQPQVVSFGQGGQGVSSASAELKIDGVSKGIITTRAMQQGFHWADKISLVAGTEYDSMMPDSIIDFYEDVDDYYIGYGGPLGPFEMNHATHVFMPYVPPIPIVGAGAIHPTMKVWIGLVGTAGLQIQMQGADGGWADASYYVASGLAGGTIKLAEIISGVSETTIPTRYWGGGGWVNGPNFVVRLTLSHVLGPTANPNPRNIDYPNFTNSSPLTAPLNWKFKRGTQVLIMPSTTVIPGDHVHFDTNPLSPGVGGFTNRYLPNGLNFDPATGAIFGMPVDIEIGITRITLTGGNGDVGWPVQKRWEVVA